MAMRFADCSSGIRRRMRELPCFPVSDYFQGAIHRKCIVAYGYANNIYPTPFRNANTDAPQECNLFRRRHMLFSEARQPSCWG